MTTATALGPAVDIGESVIDRARRGDQEAFAAVIRHYDPGLRALTFRLLGDRDRMDDVLQEAYVKAFKALPRFRGEAKLGTWLYRIAYNAAVDELRRSRRSNELPLDERLPSATSDPADIAGGRGDLSRALASAIGPVGSVVVGGIGTIVSVVVIARVWPEIRKLGTLEEPAAIA